MVTTELALKLLAQQLHMAVAYLRQAGIPSRNRLSELTVVAQSLLLELQA